MNLTLTSWRNLDLYVLKHLRQMTFGAPGQNEYGYHKPEKRLSNLQESGGIEIGFEAGCESNPLYQPAYERWWRRLDLAFVGGTGVSLLEHQN